MFSPFALKKIDTQLATLTDIFFFEPGWGEGCNKYMDCFISLLYKDQLPLSLLYMDQHCGNQGQVKFMIPG